MPTFLLKGVSPQGTERPERVEAGTAREARLNLEGRGWRDVILLQDEVCHYSGQQTQSASDPELRVEEDAETIVERWEGKNGLFWEWWRAIRKSPAFTVLMLGLLAWGIYRSQPITIIISAAGLLFFPALILVFSLPGIYYERVQKAKVWGRWDEVRRYLDKLRKSSKWSRISIGEVEFARTEGQVLAQEGRLAEAVHLFEQVKTDPNLPEWLYCSHLAGIYDQAKEYTKSLELRRRAAELAADNGAMWIDVGYASVRWLNLPASGREALRKAESCEIPEFARSYLPFVTGMILWRENKFLEAKESFQAAEDQFRAVMHMSPLMEGLVLIGQSYLCAIHRRLGDNKTADRYWKQVEKFLRAHENERELLAACER